MNCPLCGYELDLNYECPSCENDDDDEEEFPQEWP
jgi:hypothetical protein